MEKFYIVTKKSLIYKAYFRWQQNVKDVNVIVKDVMDRYGIEAREYCIGTNENYFIIYPTEHDIETYRSQMKKDSFVKSPSSFKKTSPIFKELFKLLKDADLKVLHKPAIQWEFTCCGKSRSRLFDIGGVLYASYDYDGEFDNPKGFQEIKANEFYKIIESEKEN